MNILNPYLDQSFNLCTRVSKSALTSKDQNVYIKRDDELSSMISGSKYRKYAGLIPYLKKMKIKSCVLIGSSFSNNLVGLSQLLLEHFIEPYVLILESNHKVCEGNHLFLKMLIKPSHIIEISKDEWKDRVSIAKAFSDTLEDSIFLDEGAKHSYSIIGAMSLGFDIQENQKCLNQSFDQVFLDCGTGQQAIGCLLSLNFLDSIFPIHIVSMTMDENSFHKEYVDQLEHIEDILKRPLKAFPYTFSRPEKHKSFGSTSNKLFSDLIDVLRKEGIFFDPIYSLKLYLEAKRLIKKQNSLIVHSGGALTLAGFQKQIRELIEKEEQLFESNNEDHSHKLIEHLLV